MPPTTHGLAASALLLALAAALPAQPPLAPPPLPTPVVDTPTEAAPAEAAPEPSPPSPDPETKPDKPEEPTFQPRNRGGLNWIMSHGSKRFDVIEWVSRPDLLTLADLTAWPVERDYDLDAGLNVNIFWWAGPQGDATTPVPSLPPHFFDLNLHLTWRQRWADGVTSEFTLLPGLYTDFRTTPPDGFRAPGHALGVFRLSPELHLIAGAQYLQRNRIQMLPIAGLLWEPNDRVQVRAVFPAPKVSYHLSSKSDVWAYARGEYGGGRWAYKDDRGKADQVEYDDLRAAFGFEWGGLSRAFAPAVKLGTGFLEVAYVFDRQLNFANGTPTTAVPSGWMLGFGCTW